MSTATTTTRKPALDHAEGCPRPAPRMVWDALADRPAWVCPGCWHSTVTRPGSRRH